MALFEDHSKTNQTFRAIYFDPPAQPDYIDHYTRGVGAVAGIVVSMTSHGLRIGYARDLFKLPDALKRAMRSLVESNLKELELELAGVLEGWENACVA